MLCLLTQKYTVRILSDKVVLFNFEQIFQMGVNKIYKLSIFFYGFLASYLVEKIHVCTFLQSIRESI